MSGDGCWLLAGNPAGVVSCSISAYTRSLLLVWASSQPHGCVQSKHLKNSHTHGSCQAFYDLGSDIITSLLPWLSTYPDSSGGNIGPSIDRKSLKNTLYKGPVGWKRLLRPSFWKCNLPQCPMLKSAQWTEVWEEILGLGFPWGTWEWIQVTGLE